MPNEKTDWKAERATHSTCYLLQEALRGGVGLYRRSAADAILTQLNHVRILEPAAGQELTTKDGSRLFPSVRLIDSTSSIEVRMREEAALELSHQPDKLAFMKAVQEGDLSFPMIASVRVLIREKKKDGGAAENGEDENYLSAVVMTAEEQLVDTPYLPNKACLALNPLHALLAVPTDRMLTAVLQEVNVSPHSGLVVGADKTPCEFALSVVHGRRDAEVESGELRCWPSCLHSQRAFGGFPWRWRIRRHGCGWLHRFYLHHGEFDRVQAFPKQARHSALRLGFDFKQDAPANGRFLRRSSYVHRRQGDRTQHGSRRCIQGRAALSLPSLRRLEV